MPVRPPVDYVNPFIDTAKPRIRWAFTVFTARPFGMIRLGPNTDPIGTWDAGYRYNSPVIRCFSHVHSWQLAGVPALPVTGHVPANRDFVDLGSRFRHETETAEPGYYAVRLDDDAIQVELTASERVGFHRYRFESDAPASIVLNLGNPLGPSEMSGASAQVTPNGDLEGYVENEVTRRRNRRCRIYYVLQMDRPPSAWDLRDIDGQSVRADAIEGKGIAAVARLNTSACRVILMKMGLSYVSVDQARLNLETEVPHWDFDRVRSDSREEWDRWLSVIEVKGGEEQHRVKFYTDLWRTLVGGHCISDVDGTYCDLTGESPVVRQVERAEDGAPAYPMITGQDGFWNSQWSLNLLYALVYPRVMSWTCSFLTTMYRCGGLIPRGPSAMSYTFVMIAAPSTPFIVSAWLKGIRDIDIQKAYEGMRKNAFAGGLMSKAGYEFDTCDGGGIEHYLERGYIPEGRSAAGAFHVDGAAQTLEYAYQDGSLANLAAALGKKDDERMFRERSGNAMNLFDSGTGFMRPRTLDGSWLEPFDPLSLTGFCEANSWQYTWHVPQDLPGLIRRMGGRDTFVRRLDEGFRRAQPMDFYAPKPDLRRDTAYVNYGNEPGRYVAHLFNHAGAPWLAQKWARAVRDQTFGSVEPMGFCEDDDQGKAAATSLLLSLGLFDVAGGTAPEPLYELTSPVFDRITIHLDPDYYPGGQFTVEVRNQSPDHRYIHAAELDGRPLNGPWISHRDVVSGSTLVIELGAEPNRSWGA